MQGSAKQQQHSTQDSASTKPGKMFKYRRWLGYWNPRLDSIRTETELALHVSNCQSSILASIRTETDMALLLTHHCMYLSLAALGQNLSWLCM